MQLYRQENIRKTTLVYRWLFLVAWNDKSLEKKNKTEFGIKYYNVQTIN